MVTEFRFCSRRAVFRPSRPRLGRPGGRRSSASFGSSSPEIMRKGNKCYLDQWKRLLKFRQEYVNGDVWCKYLLSFNIRFMSINILSSF